MKATNIILGTEYFWDTLMFTFDAGWSTHSKIKFIPEFDTAVHCFLILSEALKGNIVNVSWSFCINENSGDCKYIASICWHGSITPFLFPPASIIFILTFHDIKINVELTKYEKRIQIMTEKNVFILYYNILWSQRGIDPTNSPKSKKAFHTRSHCPDPRLGDSPMMIELLMRWYPDNIFLSNAMLWWPSANLKFVSSEVVARILALYLRFL